MGWHKEIGGAMSTVRQRRKNGSVYVYESHNVWDKSRKKVRAVRTYLGREDPVTGELIPSSGRPGRPPASASKKPAASQAPAADAAKDGTAAEVAELSARVADLESRLASAEAERDRLSAELASARSAIASATSILGSA